MPTSAIRRRRPPPTFDTRLRVRFADSRQGHDMTIAAGNRAIGNGRNRKSARNHNGTGIS
jgi:hypothetical protein